MGLREITAALLGRSAYQAPPSSNLLDLDSEQVEEMRRIFGGQLTPSGASQTRWYLSDLEAAEHAADTGDLSQAARLMRAARKDGTIAGVLSTCTDGLVRLPKKFRGDEKIVAELEVGHESVRSIFDEIFPPQELALLAADGRLLGVGVGELVPVEGRDYPVFVRLDPAFLVYRWFENRWYYNSTVGLLPITPGDGRWILHTPGGRQAPWQNGLWRAIGRAYIRKEHAQLHKDNYEAKLANPARVAQIPAGAGEGAKDTFLRQLMAWGVNTVFALPVGYEAKLLESNGRGWESFDTTIAAQNTEIVITIAGQTVTTDGGAGFQNSDIHKTIRADIIKAIADSLAYTINTQGLPAFVVKRHGLEALHRGVVVEWDVTPPKDRNSEATSLVTAASAIKALVEALALSGQELDVAQLCSRFGIPVLNDADGDGEADTPTGERPKLSIVGAGDEDDDDDEDIENESEVAA